MADKVRNLSCLRLFGFTDMKRIVYLLSCLLPVLAACHKNEKEEKPVTGIAVADEFAGDVLSSWYLWSKEISNSISRLDPGTCTDPVGVVREIRYHANGKEVDHWTELMENLDEFSQSVQGLGVSYGYDLQYGRFTDTDTYFLLVTYVAKDSPARKAGIKRGDIFLSINGAPITKDNIDEAFSSRSITLGFGKIVPGPGSDFSIDKDDRTVSLTAVDMYEDPILLTRTFDVNGKKVGYMVYNGFDLKSARTLADSCAFLKAAGIKELILDLRYNGGGYEFTERVLASLLAPEANVKAGDVFQTEVFNSEMAAMLKEQGYATSTNFSTTHKSPQEAGAFTVDVSDANPGIGKLYVIVSAGTASASEGLLVGLAPYLDITTVGTKTHGKYCAGYMLKPSDYYSEKHYKENIAAFSLIKDWGIYVMVSKFADKDGKNAAEPDGILAGVQVKDNPLDGCQLGDENETMLKAALQSAGKIYTKADDWTAVPHRETAGLPRRPDVLIKEGISPEFNKL